MIKLNTITATVAYDMISEMRKNTQKIEEALSSTFPIGTFNILSVPDTAPLEIPRMIAVSKEGVNVHLAPVVANFFFAPQVTDLNDMQKQLNIFAKFPELIAKKLEENEIKISYIGIVSNYIYSEEKLKAIQFLEKNLFKKSLSQTENDIFDLLGRITFVKDDVYYENIQLNNYREKIDEGNKIGISVDINDRYQTNKNPEAQSNRNSLKTIVQMHYDFMQKKLMALENNGELKL